MSTFSALYRYLLVLIQGMATVLITGGTGMLGTSLTSYLREHGHQVIIYSRSPKKAAPGGNPTYAYWDPEKGELDKDAFAAAEVLINLAGAGVADKRWTHSRKQEIIDSRVKSGELLVRSLNNIPNKIKTVLSASAIGWYGADAFIPNPHPFRESDEPAADFLGTTCQAWENAVLPAASASRRLAIFRIGIVLSNTGGALAEFRKPVQWRITPVLGSGKQVVSWIHINDLVRLFASAIAQPALDGVFNAVASNPVSSRQLMTTLARIEKGSGFLTVPVPSFALRLMLGEMSIEVLKSATVSNQKLINAGFQFHFNELEAALADLKQNRKKNRDS